MFSVALSMDSHPPGVTWHHALRARTFLPPAYFMHEIQDFFYKWGYKPIIEIRP